MKIWSLLFLSFLFPASICAQEDFVWNSKKEKIVIPFQLVANLIIIPVELNGVPLSMLLDTGAESSMLFSLPENDSIAFTHPKKIMIKGLGSEQPIEALYSGKNAIDISGYKSANFPLLIILDQDVNISSRLGVEVNGILNNSFFKDCIVSIDYTKKKMTLFKNRSVLTKRKIARFQKIPIQLQKGRPFIKVATKIDTATLDLNLLVDLGLSNGLWLFENDSVKASAAHFEDILGRGLNGSIIGQKSRVDFLDIASFQFKEALVAYPYENYFPKQYRSEGRNGSIGAGIFYRFNLIFDYQNKQLYLQPNANFKDSFQYNMSGLEVQHNGLEFVKEATKTNENTANGAEDVSHLITGGSNLHYKFELKPIFEIAAVRLNSPGALAGLLPGDKIIKINKRNIHRFTIQKITELFQSEEKRWIYIDVERNGYLISFKFQLQKII